MLRGFSWEPGYSHYPRAKRFVVLSGSTSVVDLPATDISTPFNELPSVRELFTSPSPHRNYSWYWNINQLSIEYALRLLLRTRLTLIRLTWIEETLVYWWVCFSHTLSLLMPTFAFPAAPQFLTKLLQRHWNAPLPINKLIPQFRQYAWCPIIIHAQSLD